VLYPFATSQQGVSHMLNIEYKIKLHKYGGVLRQMGVNICGSPWQYQGLSLSTLLDFTYTIIEFLKPFVQ